MRVVEFLLFQHKIRPCELDLFALLHIERKGLRKLLEIPEELLLAGSYYAHASVQQIQKF